MMLNRILLCEYIDGDTKPTRDGIALLVGVTREDLLDRWNPQTGVDNLPDDLKRKGQKRAMHARNAIGSSITTEVLACLAFRDWGARIDFDEAAGQMWAIIDRGNGP